MILISRIAGSFILPGLFFLALTLAGCVRKEEAIRYHLEKKTVYVIPDSASEKPQPVPDADTSYLEYVFSNYDLVNISDLDSSILVDLRYADTNNFLKRNFYDGLRRAYFTCDMALRICNAQYFLKKADSSLTLVVLDAARPLHLQQMMWDSLDMEPAKKFNYLSPPEATSLHNYGCAADVTLADAATGKPLDMGTEYDFFGKLSQPVHETYFLKTGELSSEARFNRQVLRYVMKAAGLKAINSEWWHFSLCDKKEAAAKYPLIR